MARAWRDDTRMPNERFMWEQLRAQVSLRDDDICAYCGVECTGIPGDDKQFTVDHVVPRIAGGKNELDNLVTACRLCNSYKGTMPIEKFKARSAKRRNWRGVETQG